MRGLIAAVVLVCLASEPAYSRKGSSSSSSKKKSKSGPVCKKGKACGNSCIAQSKVCHRSEGTARNADEEEKDAASAR